MPPRESPTPGGSPANDDFGSPGLVNVDPHSALHLRIELASRPTGCADVSGLGADRSGDQGDGVPAELVPARRGALRLAPILVERVLNRWRQLRHRIELTVPTD